MFLNVSIFWKQYPILLETVSIFWKQFGNNWIQYPNNGNGFHLNWIQYPNYGNIFHLNWKQYPNNGNRFHLNWIQYPNNGYISVYPKWINVRSDYVVRETPWLWQQVSTTAMTHATATIETSANKSSMTQDAMEQDENARCIHLQ